MSERSPRFCSWWAPGLGVTVGIIMFMCTVTSRRVRCGCTGCSFTTLGECELSLSLGLRSMKTHSSNQEMKSN